MKTNSQCVANSTSFWTKLKTELSAQRSALRLSASGANEPLALSSNPICRNAFSYMNTRSALASGSYIERTPIARPSRSGQSKESTSSYEKSETLTEAVLPVQRLRMLPKKPVRVSHRVTETRQPISCRTISMDALELVCCRSAQRRRSLQMT